MLIIRFDPVQDPVWSQIYLTEIINAIKTR